MVICEYVSDEMIKKSFENENGNKIKLTKMVQ